MINKVSVWVCTLAMLGLVFSPVTEAIGSSGSSSSSSTSSSSSSSSSSSTSSTTSTSSSARANVASRAAQSNMSTNINSSRNATSQKRIVKQVVRNLYQDLIIPLLRLLHLIMISDWHQCISTILCFWIVMQHHNLDIKQQHHILQNNMTAKDKLYTITIKDKRDKEHLIVVPKKDYDAIQKGAHVKYKNGKLITTHK